MREGKFEGMFRPQTQSGTLRSILMKGLGSRRSQNFNPGNFNQNNYNTFAKTRKFQFLIFNSEKI